MEVVSVVDFERQVLERSHSTPVLVDFWAPWCAPCRVLGPVLDEIAAEAKGRFELVKVDTEQCPQLAERYRISSIPAVKLFIKGEVSAEFAGALPAATIVRWLGEQLPSEVKELVARARTEAAAEDHDGAIASYEAALAIDATYEEAAVGLAQLLVHRDRTRALQLVSELDQGSVSYDRVAAVRTLCALLELLEDDEPAVAGAKGWPGYRRGIEALAQRRYADAFDAWIEVLRIDRKLDDDGARRACVALFVWLGDEHPLTRQYRREFSSALY